jgi:hypothetical protein
MEDGTVVDTDKASKHYEEGSYHDGSNWISKATGGQWTHEDLYRSRKGRYYVVHSSQWQGSHDHAEWVSKQEAARWLTLNDHELPEELVKVAENVTE